MVEIVIYRSKETFGIQKVKETVGALKNEKVAGLDEVTNLQVRLLKMGTTRGVIEHLNRGQCLD